MALNQHRRQPGKPVAEPSWKEQRELKRADIVFARYVREMLSTDGAGAREAAVKVTRFRPAQ